MTWNILPCNDLKEHTNDSTCECKPRVEIMEDGDLLCIHNSWDGREYKEQLIEEVKKQFKYDSRSDNNNV
jgi:hypothetical protein